MTEKEHRTLVEAERKGTVVLGVDRTFARSLYTNLSLGKIAELTGEYAYLEKAVVWFSFLCQFAALVAACVLAIPALGWWAVPVVPATVVLWLGYSMRSARGGSGLGLTTLLLLLAIVATFIPVPHAFWKNLFFIAVFSSLWLNRLLYVATTAFLRAFVLRNCRAWNAFESGLVVRENAVSM